MTCGEKIQKLRKDCGYTQEDLADILNVSRQSVSRWESDIAFPETEKLITLAKLFKCSIDYLLNPENNELKEIKDNKKTTLDIKRFLLPIITIVLGLLSIGLFFVKSLSFETGTLYLKTTVSFNFYNIAFFMLESTEYSPFINIMAVFAFICIVLSILASIFLMIFKLKGIGITVNILNILTPFFLLLSIILIIENVKAVPWILSILYLSLVVCSSYIKKLDYIECKRLMLPIFTILCVLISFIYEIVEGIIHTAFTYSFAEKNFAIIDFIFLIASIVLSIMFIIKNFEIVNKLLSISNIFLLFLNLVYLREVSTFAFLFLFIILLVNFGNKYPLGKLSLITLLLVILALSYTDLYLLRMKGAQEGYYYWDTTSFYNFSLFRLDRYDVSFAQVVAFIVAILLVVTFVTSIIYMYFDNKICSSILSIVNIITPLLFTITLICCGNGNVNFFFILALVFFYIPYLLLIVCQFYAKDLRSPLINKIFVRKTSNVTA